MNVSKNIIIFIIIFDYGLNIIKKCVLINYIINMSKHIIGHYSNINFTMDYLDLILKYLHVFVKKYTLFDYSKTKIVNFLIVKKS